MIQHRTVVGVFDNRAMAEQAIEQLRSAGCSDDQIGYVVRDSKGTTDTVTSGQKTHAGEGAVGGAVSGGVVGGLIGAAVSLLIPGFGPVIAGGILAATIGGAAIGVVGGSFLGALTGMGIPEEEAHYYQGAFESGRTIVTVQVANPQTEAIAIDILRRNGAHDATNRGGTYSTTSPAAGVGTLDPTDRGDIESDPTVRH